MTTLQTSLFEWRNLVSQTFQKNSSNGLTKLFYRSDDHEIFWNLDLAGQVSTYATWTVSYKF